MITTPPSTPADIARVCHEANRVWCQFHGDSSQLPWEFAPDWQKASVIAGVEYVLETPAAPESALHDAWCAHKRAAGWTCGPLKDAEAKTHPNLVPFGQLPTEQQFKDKLFRTIVLSMAEYPE
jgi:hypothetical protein